MLEGEREWLSRNRRRPLASKNNAHPASRVHEKPLSLSLSLSCVSRQLFHRRLFHQETCVPHERSRTKAVERAAANKVARWLRKEQWVEQGRPGPKGVLFPFRFDDVSPRSSFNRGSLRNESWKGATWNRLDEANSKSRSSNFAETIHSFPHYGLTFPNMTGAKAENRFERWNLGRPVNRVALDGESFVNLWLLHCSYLLFFPFCNFRKCHLLVRLVS